MIIALVILATMVVGLSAQVVLLHRQADQYFDVLTSIVRDHADALDALVADRFGEDE